MTTIGQLFSESACFGDSGADALLGEREPDTLPTMTVCIGALCEGGRTAILAADRLVSSPTFGLRAEGPDCKIGRVLPRVMLAAAGDPPGSSLLANIAKNSSPQPSVSETVRSVVQACTGLWRERVEQTILSRFGMMDYPSFLEACKRQELPPVVINDLWDMVKKSPAGIGFLVAGADGERAELYAATDIDGVRSLESPGFGTIGVGARLALTTLYQNPQIKHMDLPRAIYAIYDAKKDAERDPGVGKNTDMAVVSAGQEVRFLDRAAIDGLERIYQSKRPPALTDGEVGAISALIPR